MTFWDRVAGVYDIAEGLNGGVYREMLQLTEKLVPRGAAVLDTAAGTGKLSLAASRKAASVMCTDLSLPMMKKAQKNAAKAGASNISFGCRNIFDLEDADCTYDAVIAGNVLHLLDDPQKAVRELCRVTKPGGRILLPTFVLGGRKSPRLVELYKLIGFSPSQNYTPSSYRKMLEQTGCGEVKARLIRGMVSCCYAVIYKPEDK